MDTIYLPFDIIQSLFEISEKLEKRALSAKKYSVAVLQSCG